MSNKIKGIKINGTGYTFDFDEIGVVTASDGAKFHLRVDNEGNLYTEADITADEVAKPTGSTQADSLVPKLYINEVYCGGSGYNEHSAGYCSHNFVELANLTNADINLNNLSLQYAEKENVWESLPLKGVIRAGSTFLIRGAQCAAMEGAKIKVKDFDMEWYANGELKAFSSEQAKFYLTYITSGSTSTTPYQKNGSNVTLEVGYINLVGINCNDTESEGAAAYKTSGMRNKLFKRYYAMDPVSQATKAIGKRSSADDWNYVDLEKEDGEVIPNIEDYTPRASRDKKDIFYNKTKLYEDKPSMITCTFGIRATDEEDGSGATRCFNWLSKGISNEYIWIREKGKDKWGNPSESYKNLKNTDEDITLEYYNRLSVEYTDGTVFTAHKFIKSGLTSGTWEYVAGKKNDDNTPNLSLCTPIREFSVKTSTEVNKNGFTFVQTTDQQGFNWDEYYVWKATADELTRFVSNTANTAFTPSFMINTGDMTQNGNRMGEWLDYFNGKNDLLNSVEEMATIGNNDLSPAILYKMGDGGDSSKLNLENILFFYTFEMDKENPPIFTIDGAAGRYLIPSLYSFNYGGVHFICMNSEIKASAESGTDSVYNFSTNGNFYPKIKEWAEKDVEKYKDCYLKIAYCHEMPFTILTSGITAAAQDETLKEPRGGASMNTNISVEQRYWFSEFCQKNNVRLVIGGHKHTQATSYPLMENVTYDTDGTRTVESYRPIIVVNDGILEKEFSSTTLSEVVSDDTTYKYPDAWVENGSVKSDFKVQARLSTFMMESEITAGTAVVYAMSQATGYKHTSNKELPSASIPWLRYYYPLDGGAANAGQKYPFYTLWTIDKNGGYIEGRVRKVVGVFNSKGKFDINIDGQYVLNGYSAVAMDNRTLIESINGLSAAKNGVNASFDDSEIIKVTI